MHLCGCFTCLCSCFVPLVVLCLILVLLPLFIVVLHLFVAVLCIFVVILPVYRVILHLCGYFVALFGSFLSLFYLSLLSLCMSFWLYCLLTELCGFQTKILTLHTEAQAQRPPDLSDPVGPFSDPSTAMVYDSFVKFLLFLLEKYKLLLFSCTGRHLMPCSHNKVKFFHFTFKLFDHRT